MSEHLAISMSLDNVDSLESEILQMFERIWIEENVDNRYSYPRPSKNLNDVAYIFYHAWEKLNVERLYKNYLPNIILINGDVGNKIVFHGGCLSCTSQKDYGIKRCIGCLYFKFEKNKPDLRTS